MTSFGTWTRRGLFVAAIAAIGFMAADAEAQSGKPIVIGQTLALTGPLGQTGMVHKIVGEIFVDDLNKAGGLLGRPVEWKLYDDESKGSVARTQYERLITVDKVDLIIGPYATEGILAAMGVAQRYKKVFIQNTLGIPHLATYEGQFSALMIGAEPQNSFPRLVFKAYADSGFTPKSVAVVTSKFASAQFNSKGMEALAKERGMAVTYLEYDFGTRDFGAIAARVKDANPDFIWTGVLGVEGHQILDAYGKLDYKPKAHLYLYPAPSLAQVPGAEGGISQTSLEDQRPYTDDPTVKHFSEGFPRKGGQSEPALSVHRFASGQLLRRLADPDRGRQGHELSRRCEAHRMARQVGGANRHGQARLQGQVPHQLPGCDAAAPDPERQVGGGLSEGTHAAGNQIHRATMISRVHVV